MLTILVPTIHRAFYWSLLIYCAMREQSGMEAVYAAYVL